MRALSLLAFALVAAGCAPVDDPPSASELESGVTTLPGKKPGGTGPRGTCGAPARYVSVTIPELLDDPEHWEDRRVEVEGDVSMKITCLSVECLPGASCCTPTHFFTWPDDESSEVTSAVFLKDLDPEESVLGPTIAWGRVRLGSSSVGISVEGWCHPAD